MPYKFVFQRSEKKYIVDEKTLEELFRRISPHIIMDEYGRSKVCNIYFDTKNRDLMRRSIDKPVYKEKLRLRSYGIPGEDDTVFLEIKKKYKGVVYKRRESMTMKAAREYFLSGKIPGKPTQIWKELDYFVKHYRPQPLMYLAYDREAYRGVEETEIRITVDRDIRSRDYNLDLALGDSGEPLLEKGKCLVEIKVPGAMPMWLADALCHLKMYPVSFSKCGTVYKKNIHRYMDICS